MGRFVRRIDTVPPRRAGEFGGKAAGLVALVRAGFPVPPAYALSASVCDGVLAAVLPVSERPDELVRRPEVDVGELARIADTVRRASIPEPVLAELREVARDLRGSGGAALAVRSSATREDQALGAAAGLHRTTLNIRTEEALYDAIRASWASLFEPSVLTYLRASPSGRHVSMGVVLQAQIEAESAGVLFTVNPLTGDADELLVNAAYGLGCALADGRVSPDTYRVEKSSRMLRDRVVGEKAIRVVSNAAGTLVDEPVSAADRARFVLDDAALLRLVELGIRAEAQFGAPQDLEWALAAGRVYVLQARPITALALGVPTPARRARGERGARDRSRTVWSNLNVGEALPGVATPLTWSILRGFSELGFRRAFGALGCAVPKDAELFGNFRGRIYLNLSEFVSIASQVPLVRPRMLLALGGGGEVERLEADFESRSSARFLLELPVTATRFLRENYGLVARVEAFGERFAEDRRRWHATDLRLLSLTALDRKLLDVERLLDETGAIMLTCYGRFLSSVLLLRAALYVLAAPAAERLERDLVTGLADVESAAPGLALWHIAELARQEPAAAARVLAAEGPPARVAELPDGPTRRALERFLLAYGFRGPREAEVAAPRWSEDPRLLFATLRLHLERGDAEGPVAVERRQRAVREAAVAEFERRVPSPARAPVRHLLAMVHRFTRLRERLRAHVTEVLGMFRALASEVSRRLEAREPACGPDAAFFLTLDELHGILGRDLPPIALLVRQRRAQHARDQALPDPPDTFVGSPPAALPPVASADELTGLAASSGRAEGLVRVIRSPDEVASLRHGEVLVVPYADVGWSPVFLVAAALVTDLGGPLSHVAVVAREFGLPTVVNVKVGTRVLATGDRVVVDGDRGTVRVVARAGSADPGAKAPA